MKERRGKPRRDATGERFGKLVAIKDTGATGPLGRVWLFQCDCGAEAVFSLGKVTLGNQKHCGCSRRTGDHKRSPVYIHWQAMRQRCRDPKSSTFHCYGGRGVQICSEWDEFKAFRDWALENGFEAGLTLDRINNDGDYEPDNCRWASRKQQGMNRRTTLWVEWNGKRMPLSHACAAEGISFGTVLSRMKAGRSFHEALTAPRNSRA